MTNNKVLIISIIVFIIFSTFFVGVNIISELKRVPYINKNDLRNTLSVVGQGEIYVSPDMAIVNFSVIEEGPNAQAVLNSNSKKANQLIDFLKANGVDENNIKTISFNIYPRYEYEKLDYYGSLGKRVLVGYEAHQSIEARIYDIDSVGSILEGGVRSGANQVNGINFTIEKENEYLKEAKLMAIDDAKEKALKLADRLGVKLVRIISYEEIGSPISPFHSRNELDLESAQEITPNIQFGQNRIFSTISLIYEIK